MEDLSPEYSSWKETLEAEFCPPLDTTIVAVLVADHISGEKPSDLEAMLKMLCEQLSELAASATADQDNHANYPDDLHLSAPSASTEDSRDADGVFSQTGFESNSSSTSSTSPLREPATSTHPQSALAFLQASFPHILLEKLKISLNIADMDMEGIVEDLLSEEYVRGLEERGLQDEEIDKEIEKWTEVSQELKGTSHPAVVSRKRKAKGKTITINDVRQKQHIRPESQFRFADDPWSQVASISSYLETLLQRHSSFFQSYFHKPEYPTPAIAVRAALNSISQELKESDADQDKDETSVLFSLLELVRTSPDFAFDNLDSEARARLCADAELSLAAAGGSPDVGFDILEFLHGLELDSESAQEMGVYHSPASPLFASISSPSANAQSTPKATTWTGTPPVSPSSPIKNATGSIFPPSIAPNQRPPPAPSQSSWQLVAPARPKPPAVHPLAAHIPAYNPHNVRRRKARPTHPSLSNPAASRSGNSKPMFGIKGRGDAALGGYKARIEACNARRDEALRTASRHWSSGGARGRGGEVAFYYAQEAQRHQAEAQKIRLDALRELADGKRCASSDSDTVDVHYCTTSEALTIVREVLDEGWASPARPLHVITGRGQHSAGGVAVLGPVMRKALEHDGWVIGRWDGGISVRGRVR